MLRPHPAISQLHTIDRKWKSAGVFTQATAAWKLLSAPRARRYDLIIRLTEHNRGAWIKCLTKAKYGVAKRVPDTAFSLPPTPAALAATMAAAAEK